MASYDPIKAAPLTRPPHPTRADLASRLTDAVVPCACRASAASTLAEHDAHDMPSISSTTICA